MYDRALVCHCYTIAFLNYYPDTTCIIMKLRLLCTRIQ